MKSDIQTIKDHTQYFPEKYLEVYKNVLAKSENRTSPNDLEDLMNTISLRFSWENQDVESAKLEQEAAILLQQLKIEHLKERRQQVRNLIRDLERLGDEARLQEALQEFNNLSRELENH